MTTQDHHDRVRIFQPFLHPRKMAQGVQLPEHSWLSLNKPDELSLLLQAGSWGDLCGSAQATYRPCHVIIMFLHDHAATTASYSSILPNITNNRPFHLSNPFSCSCAFCSSSNVIIRPCPCPSSAHFHFRTSSDCKMIPLSRRY